MPKVKLVENSSLMTEAGLCRLADINDDVEVYGVDRSGKLSLINVSISHLGNTSHTAYIGCTRSLGLFHSETRIMNSDGASFSTSELIYSCAIQEQRFEIELATVQKPLGSWIVAMLIGQLRHFSLVESENHAVLQAQGDCSGLESTNCISVERTNFLDCDRGHIIVDLSAFAEALVENWKETISRFVLCWCSYNPEEGIVEIDINRNFWALWYLMATMTDEYSYHLEYDSLQHSTTVRLQEGSSASHNDLSKGGVGFLRLGQVESYELQWSDTQWNPLSSGFILSSS